MTSSEDKKDPEKEDNPPKSKDPSIVEFTRNTEPEEFLADLMKMMDRERH
jgi:hypothetical protein|tara:strand:+ start:684 stop:833 length:150 start_codon:yes stop_codon:yes gene_type:complete